MRTGTRGALGLAAVVASAAAFATSGSLATALIAALRPAIYVKGGDYSATPGGVGKPLPEAAAVRADEPSGGGRLGRAAGLLGDRRRAVRVLDEHHLVHRASWARATGRCSTCARRAVSRAHGARARS